MKPTRSVRLKKYGVVYKEYIKNVKEAKSEARGDAKDDARGGAKSTAKSEAKSEAKRSPPKTRHMVPTRDKSGGKSGSKHVNKSDETRVEKKVSALNMYQKFVQDESSRDKYKSMKGSDRMLAISQAWEKKKRKEKRETKKK
jgi:hypothetical protein